MTEQEIDELLARAMPDYCPCAKCQRYFSSAASDIRAALAAAGIDLIQRSPLIALNRALCNFLNEAGDPFEPVDMWRDSTWRAVKRLSEATKAAREESCLKWPDAAHTAQMDSTSPGISERRKRLKERDDG
jgi:hypothetical protein